MRKINRRSFLQYSIAMAGTSWIPGFAQASAQQNATPLPFEWMVSGVDRRDGRHGISWRRSYPRLIADSTEQPGWVETGFRGHGVAHHPRRPGHTLLFGRRPGWWFAEVDLQQNVLTHKIAAPSGSHFTGHGCFSRDGSRLYTSENNFEAGGQAVVGIWESDQYRRIGAIRLKGGIGLHDLRLHPNGRWLIAAVGGLLTHPDRGREKLNLHSMHSYLLYLDRNSGDVVQKVAVAEEKSSIRHLHVAPDGLVSVAIQLQRKVTGHQYTVPLMGTHRFGDAEIDLFDSNEEAHDEMQDYVGSTVISPLSRVVGYTSPRGNRASFWNIDTRKWLGSHAMTDVCGLGLSGNERYFILSNSIGEVRYINSQTTKEVRPLRRSYPSMRWDNHMLVV
ncbi:MAG: DUF1513 domain-containing protein [Gammaproteobacteria bacterium]|nr:DUF1513 domain-containing protein [Gammaproteobacteria bacterium]MBT3489061.1 DUF1513 domain-containing protein [Gammaproteobacteria bacterium]MBT3718149.1 DUF1513 domain-containing protein [Gammaproteobacteria bacterium]MBT3844163.1 DUF1513 domain-containing protein [Gammaproteobacteria bacterium]MBT3893143.1 DUF1513 domain-containing protein [Gammaproteobacteria bacterium]